MKNTTHKPSRRRLAQIYTEAAERIEGKYSFGCCNAIFMSCDDRETDMGQKFNDGYWWRPSNKTPRIIALLLMAELAKDGQLD